jgi:hypothetical protein
MATLLRDEDSMLSSKQCAEFVQVQVRIFSIDSVNGSEDSTVDNSLCSDDWRCWPSNAAMLSKDLMPMVETSMWDQQGETNIFNLPAIIPEVKSTEFPVGADSTIDHDGKKEMWILTQCNLRHSTSALGCCYVACASPRRKMMNAITFGNSCKDDSLVNWGLVTVWMLQPKLKCTNYKLA